MSLKTGLSCEKGAMNVYWEFTRLEQSYCCSLGETTKEYRTLHLYDPINHKIYTGYKTLQVN